MTITKLFSCLLGLLISVLILSCKNKTQINNDTASVTQKQTKPNVIVIVADDAGYVDFGFMGSEDLDTPHIDNLAKNGVVFTDCLLYTSPSPRDRG